MLSLATKRPLTGEWVFERCRVLILNLEDGPDELRRRLQARGPQSAAQFVWAIFETEDQHAATLKYPFARQGAPGGQ